MGTLRLGPGEECPDLAIWIYPRFRGHGYGTSAFRLGVESCFRALDLKSVGAGCYAENARSLRMLEKIGFRRDPGNDLRETNPFTGEETTQLSFILPRELFFQIEEGVYIGRDIEIVAAGAYMITYGRNRTGDFLESCLYRDGICVGICHTSPALTARGAKPDVWRWAFVFHGAARATDEEMRARLGEPLAVSSTDEGVRVSFGDGIVYEAALAEWIEKTPPAPTISAETVGDCWRLWSAGVREEIYPVEGRETFIGVTINTMRHMYIFEMTPGSIYCRAARYVSTNRGVVFNQNFRQGGEAYMIPDNRAAREPLSFDEDRFRTDACFWDDRSVYCRSSPSRRTRSF